MKANGVELNRSWYANFCAELAEREKNPRSGKPDCPVCHGRGIVDPVPHSVWTSGTTQGPTCPVCMTWQFSQRHLNSYRYPEVPK